MVGCALFPTLRSRLAPAYRQRLCGQSCLVQLPYIASACSAILKPRSSGDLVLARFDLLVEELFHPAAIEADQVVVVRAGVQLEDRLAGFKVIAVQQAGLFELGQHPVHGRQADVHVLGQQDLVDVFRRQVPHRAVLENFQDFQPRQVAFRPLAFRSVGLLLMFCYS
jgi:hypothetical protein